MPRPRIDPCWQERIKQITENQPRIGPERVARLLEDEARQMGRNDWPSARTVGRAQQEYRRQPEEKREQYRQFRWPESMDQGALPWEASGAALELLRHLHQRNRGRPLVGTVRWFWRVSSVAPDAPIEKRLTAAAYLHVAEAAGDLVGDVPVRQVEWWLAYTPWRSERDSGAYAVALEEPEPIPPFPARFPLHIDDLKGLAEAWESIQEAMTGRPLPRGSEQKGGAQ